MHEINNSNNYISGSAQILCEIIEDEKKVLNGKLNKEDLEQIEYLKKTIKLGIDKTNTILGNLQKSGLSGTSFSSIDLSATINECLKVIQKKALDKNIEFIRKYPESLNIDGNGDLVHQILINILDNAIDASDDCGKITVMVDTVEDSVNISIQDEGVGIPIENLDRIYDPFFTTKQVGEGAGLGLYMVYGYVTNHHGSFNVRSYENGTDFTITLPINQAKNKFEKPDFILASASI